MWRVLRAWDRMAVGKRIDLAPMELHRRARFAFPLTPHHYLRERYDVGCELPEAASKMHSRRKESGFGPISFFPGRLSWLSFALAMRPWGQEPRSISIPAEEQVQQQARARNQTQAGRQSLRERVVDRIGWRAGWD